jgi:hypothetical protein
MGKVLSKKNMTCLFKFCCLLLMLYLLYAVLKPVITEGLAQQVECSGNDTAGWYAMCGENKYSSSTYDITSYTSEKACDISMNGIMCDTFNIDCSCEKK